MATGTGFHFREPAWYNELDSTNTRLRGDHAQNPLPAGTVCAAKTQTRGRGRMGNVWHSPPRGDLTFSFLWVGSKTLIELGSLPMAVALGVGDWLAGLGIETRCKWPNDVMANDGKLCGIITETSRQDSVVSVVVGVGVNLVDSPKRSAVAGRPVASVERETGRAPGDPVMLLPNLLAALESRIAIWESEGFAAIRRDLSTRLWGIGRRVEVRDGDQRRCGTLVGLDEIGGLILAGGDGDFSVVSGIVGLEPDRHSLL